MAKEEALEHAKKLKEFCRDRDNLDEPCEDCPFHFYDGFAGFCVLNYGLYPNEWFNPQAESEELKGENKKECSTCKSDNSLENCLGCIEYGHWELKEDNKQSKCNSCRNNTDELSGECYECVKGIKDNYIEELKGE